ncbi:MAG: alpha/beta fold hydrolase [Rhodocyclaceae bacterium]
MTFIFILLALTGCAISPPYMPETQAIEPGRLPPPNTSLSIPGLGPCTDSPDPTLHLDTNQPVTVLVHGCNGSAGRFRSLAQLYAFHGQQAVCFSYDDRDSLVNSSGKLITAVEALAGKVRGRDVTLIGHSMGGLVARKAMERDRREWLRNDARLQLVTISAPLAGIDAASPCGSSFLQWASLGVVPGICWLITGDNWFEITSASDFIQRPEPLNPSVRRYLKVVTDERGTCRRESADGKCLESDYIFSLAEQYQPVIDRYPQVTNVEVEAGHVEIVGNKEIAPRKLLNVLQQQGLLALTPPERLAALERLLAELY